MILTDLHVHTTFADGAKSPREMIEAGIQLGMQSIGISEHGHVSFDESAGMTPEQMRAYNDTMRRLKEEYSRVIDVFHGLENDASQLHEAKAYDYTIGSVHYAMKDGAYYCVDHSAQHIMDALEQAFDGDGMAFVQAYYAEVIRLSHKHAADICGHFDVVKKCNSGNRFFDEASIAYRRLALEALEEVVQNGMLLEVSTAAIARGVSKDPYPAAFLLRRAQQLGARVVMNSDAHDDRFLCFRFAETAALLKHIGFQERWILKKEGFCPCPL